MGLKIVHDGTGPGEVQERCCICRAPTRWWYGTGTRNVALCPDCAKTARATALPTKAEWIAKERAIRLRHPTTPTQAPGPMNDADEIAAFEASRPNLWRPAGR